VRLLSLDLSTSTGWALFVDGQRADQGRFPKISIRDFNVNAHPEKSPSYPRNIMDAAHELAKLVTQKIAEIKPDHIVIENTVKGRNRSTQRCLEWCHFAVLGEIYAAKIPFTYMDPSQWRTILDIRLTSADKKNNKEVNAGKKRGKINRKHLALRYCNEKYGLDLLVKDDDVADAICLAEAFLKLKETAPVAADRVSEFAT
jgi:Holliday junction resolvasome RuvABC endonuclease subunit